MATIGIDLGTTYSCVAIYRSDDSGVEIVPNDRGSNTSPSMVAFLDDEILVGEGAKEIAKIEPEKVVFDVKRLIGQNYYDPKIQEYSKIWPFKLADNDGKVHVEINGKVYSPEDVTSHVVSFLKEQAENFLAGEVKSAVVTIPAYFNEEQKQITKSACAKAGLKVVQLLTEPTAAAIAYYCQRRDRKEKNVLIFDLGGGTFDVAFVNFTENVIKIKKIGGDPHLGGEDFDNTMLQYCLEEFKKKHGVNLQDTSTDDPDLNSRRARNLRRIKAECEQAKVYLSAAKKVIVSLDAIHKETSLVVPFPRENFERMNELRFQRCLHLVKINLLESGMGKDNIDDIVLVGGSSRIPRVQELLKYFFGKPLSKSINPDEAVAYGAMMQAHFLTTPGQRVIIEQLDLEISQVTNKYKLEDLGGRLPTLADAKSSTEGNRKMVAGIKINGIENKSGASYQNIMLQVDRANYATQKPYDAAPSPIGCNVNTSAPNIHALYLDTIASHLTKAGGTALDIGSGCGYMTACLAILLGEKGRVIGIDHMEELVDQSIKNITMDNPRLLSSGRITFVVGDAMEGLPSQGPYDVIHIGAALPKLSANAKLLDQLKPGGILVSPVVKPNGSQTLVKAIKANDGAVKITDICGVIFTTMKSAAEQLRK